MAHLLERCAFILVCRAKVGVQRKDAYSPRKPAQATSGRAVYVVFAGVHRMKPDGLCLVPGEYIRHRLVEDRKLVVDGSFASRNPRIQDGRCYRQRERDAFGRMPM